MAQEQQQTPICYLPMDDPFINQTQQQEKEEPPTGYPPMGNANFINQTQQQQSPAGYPPMDNPNFINQTQQQQSPAGYPPVWNNNNNNNNQQQSVPVQNYQPSGPNFVLVQPSFGMPTYEKKVAVIGSEYCSPNPVDLIITRKVLHISNGNFTVKDVNRNLMYKIKDGIQLLHDRRVLSNAEGNSIVTMQEKIKTAHNRWNAFKRDSRDLSQLLFSAKKSSLVQFRTELDVFLASNNGTEGLCDFKIKGSWLKRSCVIYGGESNAIIAQMRKKTTVGSVLLGKDKFMVTVYPNVDSAFIVALIVILDAINE